MRKNIILHSNVGKRRNMKRIYKINNNPMDLRNIYLSTLIAEWPRIYNYNNQVLKNYLDVIYDETSGIVVVPVNTSGKVKGATGEFVTLVADDIIVRRNITQLNEDTSTYSGTFLAQDGSTVTVVNGIIVSVG